MLYLPDVVRPPQRPATSIYEDSPAHPGFITVEGPDGGGKTTQVVMLARALSAYGLDDRVMTREPGGSRVGDDIREVLLHGYEMDVATEAFLFIAQRAAHVEQVIRPNVEAGRIVLSDRFGAATDAYQLHGRDRYDLAPAVHAAHQVIGIKPGRTYVLVGDVETLLSRVGRRVVGDDAQEDRIEAAGLGFHRRTLEGYLLHAEENPEVKLVDAMRTPEEVHAEILEDLVEHLTQYGYLPLAQDPSANLRTAG